MSGMRWNVLGSGLCAAALVLSGLPALAQANISRACIAEYAAKKAAIEARGLTRLDFFAECMMRPAAAAPPAPSATTTAPAGQAGTASPAPQAGTSSAAATPAGTAVADTKSVLLVVHVTAANTTMARLATFTNRNACEAAAKALKASLRRAADVAPLDCVSPAAFASATTAPLK